MPRASSQSQSRSQSQSKSGRVQKTGSSSREGRTSRGRSSASASHVGRRSSASGGLTTTSLSRSTGQGSSRQSAYGPDYDQNLVDSGIYPILHIYPNGCQPPRPQNWEEIKTVLARRRDSLSPSRFTDDDFDKFQLLAENSTRENQAFSQRIYPVIEGETGQAADTLGTACGQVQFNNLHPITIEPTVPGNPDRFHGSRPEELDKRVRDQLDHFIVPSTQKDLPMLPNLFFAAKGPAGTARVAKNQAVYDGALGARAMQRLASYRPRQDGEGEEEDHLVFDNSASVLTCTYVDNNLKICTVHPIHKSAEAPIYQPNAGQTTTPVAKYVTVLVNGWNMTGNAKTFREGAAALRNGIEWAKAQRDAVITRANDLVNNVQTETAENPAVANTSFSSQDTVSGPTSSVVTDTSTDELGMSMRVVE